MIGWENNQGAYFINQLKDNIDSVNSSLETYIEELKTEIGKLTDLTTTAKTNVVSAINEVDSDISTVDGKIGTLNSLTTVSKTDAVSAINEVNAKIVPLGTIGGKKQLTLTNTSETFVIILVFGISNSNTVKCGYLVLLPSSGNASAEVVFNAGSNIDISSGTKSVIIKNNATSTNMYTYGIILKSASYTAIVDDIPST